MVKQNDTDEYNENEQEDAILDNSQLKRSILQYHRSSSDKISQPEVRFIQKQVAANIIGKVQ